MGCPGTYKNNISASVSPMFFLKDHLGSVRAVVAQTGAVQQVNEYYPFGDLFPTSETDNSGNRFRFTGKELGAETGLYDFSARFLHPRFGRFTTLDPLAEKYPSVSPYAYCKCNPVRYIDPDGMDWYAYYHGRQDSYENMLPYMSYAWTEAKSQEELDALGIQGTYMGEAVVVFDGYYDEKLGKDGTLTGEGAKPADVTVYGPRGADDIESYIGFTMSSDFKTFGAIDNGVYDVSFKSNNPKNKIPKTHTVNKGKELDCLNGVNTSYPNFDAHSPTQKNAIYVHRTNIGGFAGYNKEKNVAVSTGCLLIDDSDWLRYETQINFTPYKLVVRRK